MTHDKHSQKGDKILLPPSAFDTLARLQVDYPMLFQLRFGDRYTHCGVLEFTAEEGCAYIPFWIMQNLRMEEGGLVTVENVSLPKANFVKLQPQSVDFLEISNPRAVLEHTLRNFSCVTVGDILQIPYNNKIYSIQLKEVKPAPAACIIETDCNVDFDAPVGYQEPTPRSSACPSPTSTATSMTDAKMESTEDSKPNGIRIVDGKIIRPEQQAAPQNAIKDLVAHRTGQTGLQLNAAIPEAAPDIDYWAVNAGDGARLDGKKPAELKDPNGNVIDTRKLREEAAVKRAEQATKETGMNRGKTLSGKEAQTTPTTPTTVSKRKSRVGSKYSKLKGSGVAFQGSANSFNE